MKKWIWITLAVGAALLILSGCDLFTRSFYLSQGDFPAPGTGSLVLIVDGAELPTKTITPGLTMSAEAYALSFDGPTSADDFGTVIGDTGLFTPTGLTPGAWTVTVKAYNSDTDFIDTGPTTTLIGAIDGVPTATRGFTISAGSSTPLVVPVVPLTGTGNLRIFVSWPENVGVAEALAISLTPGGDVLSDDIVVNTDETTRSAVYNSPSALDARYYIMVLRIEDEASLIWGWMEAVRILAGQDTDTGTKFTLTSLEGAGGLTLSTNTSLQNPVQITFNPATISNLTHGVTALSVTANTVPADTGSYTYQWYLDGAVVSAKTTATFALPAGDPLLTLGSHNLSVLVTSASVLSSETISFTVVAP